MKHFVLLRGNKEGKIIYFTFTFENFIKITISTQIQDNFNFKMTPHNN